MSSPAWKHAANEKSPNPRASMIAVRSSPPTYGITPTNRASMPPSSIKPLSSPSSSSSSSRTPTWSAYVPSHAPTRLSTQAFTKFVSPAPNVPSASMRQLICIQGIVRAWIAARTLKKRVHLHLFRTKVAFEILSSEQSYMKDLLVLINEFYMPMSSQCPPEQVDIVFCNVKDILAAHTLLIAILEDKLKHWGYSALIAKDIIPVIEKLSCYERYINNYNRAIEFLKENQQNQTSIHKLFEQKATAKVCRGMGINAFLITPVQRLPRLILLMREIIRYTPEDHPDIEYAKEALKKMQELAQQLNDSKRKAENQDKIDVITRSVSGLTLELSTRQFLKEGALEEIVTNKTSVRTALTKSGGTSRSIKELVGYYVFMFNDTLICAKRLSATARVMMNLGKKGIQYQFSAPSVIPLPKYARASVDTTVDNAFVISSLDPEDETKQEHRIFVAANGKERDEWIKLINSR